MSQRRKTIEMMDRIIDDLMHIQNNHGLPITYMDRIMYVRHDLIRIQRDLVELGYDLEDKGT